METVVRNYYHCECVTVTYKHDQPKHTNIQSTTGPSITADQPKHTNIQSTTGPSITADQPKHTFNRQQVLRSLQTSPNTQTFNRQQVLRSLQICYLKNYFLLTINKTSVFIHQEHINKPVLFPLASSLVLTSFSVPRLFCQLPSSHLRHHEQHSTLS